jgi:hypothetical protein
VSRYEDRLLTCPHCQHQFNQSVAVSLDGDAAAQRQAILDGTFQRLTCAACGTAFVADGPLIYIDFDAKLWISVFPTPWESAWWDHEDEPQVVFQRYMIDHCPPLVRSCAPGFTVRAVFGIERLREKLVAYDAAIDDRVLEAYKLDLLRGLGPYDLAQSARPRLREVSATEAVFHVPRPEPGAPDRNAIVRIPRTEIDRVAAERDGAWAATLEAVSAGPYVDLGRIFVPRRSVVVA